MKEFKINEFLTLKLEDDITRIYFRGEYFDECNYLMLNVPIDDTKKLKEIKTVDDIIDILGWTAKGQKGVKYSWSAKEQEGVEYNVDPETEFWGFCSNLQAWYEHNYDSGLLHSVLAFPLLIDLSIVDPVARKVLKEEIVKRFESGAPKDFAYIMQQYQLLGYFDKKERSILIEQSFSAILTAIEELPAYYAKYHLFYDLIGVLRGIDLIKKYKPQLNALFLDLLRGIENLDDEAKISSPFIGYNDRCDAFRYLLGIAKRTGWFEEHFFVFFKAVDILCDEDKYDAFVRLIDSIKGTFLFVKYKSQLKTLFSNIVALIDKALEAHQYDYFTNLINIAREAGWIKEHFPALLGVIAKLDNRNRVNYFAFIDLLNLAREKGWFNEYLLVLKAQFLTLVERIDNLPDEGRRYYAHYEEGKYDAFSRLLKFAKKLGWMKYTSLTFLEVVDKLPDKDKYNAFSSIVETLIDSGWKEDYFPPFLKVMNRLYDKDKYKSFYDLIDFQFNKLKNLKQDKD